MIGGFLGRGLVLIFGYAYPAYECYKTVEKNKPEIEQLHFWCLYWILIAIITVAERVVDIFVSWLPFYGEAKLAFIIYLWHPKTKGSKFIYDSFFKPYIAKHESEIDRCLLELKIRAGDTAYMYIQKFAGYGQSRFYEILQLVATQSIPRPRPAQAQQPAPKSGHPPRQQSAARVQPDDKISSTSSAPIKKSVSMPDVSPNRATNGEETTEPVSARAQKFMNKSTTSQEETVMEETIHVTRGRLKKARSNSTQE